MEKMAEDTTNEMVKEEEVTYQVVRKRSDGEVVGVVATPANNRFVGVTIEGERYNIDRISKAEFETYREFDVPLYRIDPQ